jgi:hypothetical protein
MAGRGKKSYRTTKKSRRNIRSTKKVLIDTQAIRQLQTYRYPFSVATSCPKIPDGKVTQSIGLRAQATTVTTSKETLFILAPTFTTGLTIHNQVTVNTVSSLTTNYASNPLFSTDVDEIAGGSNNLKVKNKNDTLGKWRVVSQGLRLKCVNNDDNNDGYWEAIRLNSNDSSDFFLPFLNSQDSKKGYIRPSYNFLEHCWDKVNWLQNPTYCSGKVKNLGQFEFRLSPQVGEHDFIAVPKTIELNESNLDAKFDNTVDDGVNLFHLFRYCLDTSFDIVCIKVQGRTDGNTSIHSHLVQNVEARPYEEADDTIFLTETVNAGAFLKNRQLEFKRVDRLAATFIGGPKNT